jgi:hypothetical protein
MSTYPILNVLCLAVCVAAAPLVVFADEPATPPAGSNMMGHSPASKEHTMMDRGVATSAPESNDASDNGMGHSPASKEHAMMNRKSGMASKAPDGSASADNGMGHSPASKEHGMMKHKQHKPRKGDAAAKPSQQ